MNKFENYLKESPSNTISSLKFSPNDNLLLSTSWDSNVYVHNTNSSENYQKESASNLVAKQIFAHPQLDCCFEAKNNNFIYSVGLDGDMNRIDLDLLSTSIIFSNQAPLHRVHHEEITNMIFTSGWDSKLKALDIRSESKHLQTINTDLEIHHFVFSGDKLVVAGIDNSNTNIIKIYDLRSLNKCINNHESPLKYPTNSLCATNTGDGYVIGSVEGKIAVEYFENYFQSDNTNNLNKKNYAFKCHREETESRSIINSVNTLCYHPQANYFFSGGSDNYLYAWDNDKKKKMFKSPQLLHPIVASSINYDGSILALASSENYEDFNFSYRSEGDKHRIIIVDLNSYL